MEDEKGVDYLKKTIVDMLNRRMDEKSELYTPGVKWGVSFNVEEVTDNTVLDGITLKDLKRLLS
jgi:hypothetical protein